MVNEKEKQEAIEFLQSKKNLDGFIVLGITDADKPQCKESSYCVGPTGAMAQMIFDFLEDNLLVKDDFFKILHLSNAEMIKKLADQMIGDGNNAE